MKIKVSAAMMRRNPSMAQAVEKLLTLAAAEGTASNGTSKRKRGVRSDWTLLLSVESAQVKVHVPSIREDPHFSVAARMPSAAREARPVGTGDASIVGTLILHGIIYIKST